MVRIPEFDWSAKEANQADLFVPRFSFFELNNPFALIESRGLVQGTRLLPVVAGRARAEVEQKDAGGAGCTARIAYTIYCKLLTF